MIDNKESKIKLKNHDLICLIKMPYTYFIFTARCCVIRCNSTNIPILEIINQIKLYSVMY